ncbi:MAG: isoprenyl transferase [Lachnospiraceae bacterium]|nr:isoprenyl transferase [Lachnospiraceae bacterium]
MARKKAEPVELHVPQHVAIILDGNGRWARKRLLPRSAGHSAGARTVEDCCEWAWDLGIKYLTVYAFSTENWRRSDDEVAYLMNLLRDYMKNCLARSRKNNMRVRVIGDKSRLDEDLRASIEELENESASFTGLNFTVAINYGGRDEILRAFRKMTVDLSKNAGSSPDNLDNELEKIDEKMISSYLDTAEIPDPDLIIRTSGEQRISNFLLWQLAYSEFYFTDTLWPDFSKKELMKAIEYYSQRNRRFGGV